MNPWSGVSWLGANGTRKRTPFEQVRLAVRIMNNQHYQDVIQRAEDSLGTRAQMIGPVDLSRNLLRAWIDRVCRTYYVPPFQSGLDERLPALLGDVSASVTVDRYAKAGGRPMPTTAAQASALALRYEQAAGYCGVLLTASERTGRINCTVVTPDLLELEYTSDDPYEPTVIRHHGSRLLGGQVREVLDVYDLTDPKRPSYTVRVGTQDVTRDALGETYAGDAYPWRDDAGRPYHPIVIRGNPGQVYDRAQLVEASLLVAVRWTAWGSGTDHASHPQRNVRGLRIAAADSSTDSRESGLVTGPESVVRWVDEDPEKPGTNWQDAPAFDPMTIATAIGHYEMLSMSFLGLSSAQDRSGGEPNAREMEALDEVTRSTYSEARRFDGELLRRCAALANASKAIDASGLAETAPATLYREEITEALGSVQAPAQTPPPPPTTPTEEPTDA